MIKFSGLVDLKPLREFQEDEGEGEDNVDPMQFEEGGKLLKAELMQLYKQASELFNMLGENEETESWIRDMISRSADAINTVHSHVTYEKSSAKALGDGEGTPADLRAGGDRWIGGRDRDGEDSSPRSSF